MSQALRFINADQALGLLKFPALIDALYLGHRQKPASRADLLLSDAGIEPSQNHFLLRAAWQSEQVLGAKLVSVFPANHQKYPELPAIQGLYALFDASNGTPLACIDGTVITWFKTAADSALAARFLAREQAKTLLMVGAGAMAPFLIQAHLAVRPSIARILLWNRHPARAKSLRDNLQVKARVSVYTDLKSAVQEADIISCATMTKHPLIHGEWLTPGCHLDLVGGYTRDMREADDTAVQRSRVYVDCYDTTLEDVGDIWQPLNNGVLKPDQIQADLYQLCSGKHPGRQADTEITLYKNGGGGHLDLMTAKHLLDLCGGD